MKMFFESIESKRIKNDFVFLSCQRSNMRNRSTETQLEKELSETNEKKSSLNERLINQAQTVDLYLLTE